MTYRGVQRAAQRARAARADSVARAFDETADPAAMTDNQLTASIYRLQSRRTVSVQTRLETLCAERNRRIASDGNAARFV